MYNSITAEFDKLVLDHKNPRFITNSKRRITQNEIMKYLIEYEFVIELAESIKNYGGLIPGERLLVTKENNEYIVLEGNRRTAAIRLLLYPDGIINNLSLSHRDITKIESFKKNTNPNLIKQFTKFEVDFVKTREDAIYSLTERHIEGIRTWSQISKMYFYQQHFDSGKTISEIKKYSPESSRTIADYLRKYSFLRFVLNSYIVKYPSGIFSNSDFETTIPTELIIQRVYNSTKDRLKIKFNDKYQMEKQHYSKEQYQLLKEIFADIAYLYWDLNLIDTRILNTVEDFQHVFFNETYENASEETLNIGKQILKLEESLKKNTNITVEKPSESDRNKNKKIEIIKVEIDKDEHIQNTNNQQKITSNNTNTEESKNTEEYSSSNINVQENTDSTNTRRLTNPSSVMYLTSAYSVAKNYKENPKINTLKKELANLKYKEFTISTMFLIRSLLETYTHEYIDYFANLDNSNSLKMKAVPKQRNQRTKNLQEYLFDDIYNHLKNVLKKYPDTQELIKTTLSTNNNTPLTQIINYYIHSTKNFPDKTEVLEAWKKAVQIINTLDEILYEQHSGQVD